MMFVQILRGIDVKTAKAVGPFADSTVLSEPQEVLSALFNTSLVGLAICDKQLRFRAVNKALAAMNGVLPEAHLGKTICDVLGRAAIALERPFRHVFSSGQEVSNLEVCAKLAKRNEVGYWIENYFPIKDAAGRVKQVGALVVEVTEQKNLQHSIRGATEKVIRNLFLAAQDSGALLRQIADGCPPQIADIRPNLHPHSVKGLSKQEPFLSLEGVPEVLATRSESEENAKVCAVTLTPREREVVKLLADGKGNKETAALLGISVKTIEAHRARIMLKLGLHTNTELLHYAIRNKILGLSDM